MGLPPALDPRRRRRRGQLPPPPAPDNGPYWNPTDKNAAIGLSNGNRRANRASGSGSVAVRSLLGHATGKYYAEFVVSALDVESTLMVGVGSLSATLDNFVGLDGHGYGYYQDTGDIYHSASPVASGDPFGLSNVIGVAYDADGDKLHLSLDGDWQTGGDPGDGEGGLTTSLEDDVHLMASISSTGTSVDLNLSNDEFAFPIPNGYTPWNDESGEGGEGG